LSDTKVPSFLEIDAIISLFPQLKFVSEFWEPHIKHTSHTHHFSTMKISASITTALTLAVALALLTPNAQAFSTLKATPSPRLTLTLTNNQWRLPAAFNSEDITTIEPSFLPKGIIDDTSLSSSSLSPVTISKDADAEYRRGIATIAFITILFSSNSPVLHSVFVNASNPPPVLLLNAATSIIALMGLITFGPILNSLVPLPKTLQMQESNTNSFSFTNIKAGTELGFWKTLGTTANLYGLSLTSANHAAFLIQLTTLIVPVVQGAMGIPIPQRIWTAIGLALAGIVMFTQDAAGAGSGGSAVDLMENTSLMGDALCAVAAGFYATYDLRLFDYGKKVPPLPLIRTKIATQAVLSCAILAFASEGGIMAAKEYLEGLSNSPTDALLIGSAAVWSGLAINAVAPFLQVGGQQMVGASRAQVLYASQPLWASILSFALLGETMGNQGMMGASLFLIAIFFAATAESPDPNCGQDDCEV
jgi:drug/metabolite transporter (DMT)-like permease